METASRTSLGVLLLGIGCIGRAEGQAPDEYPEAVRFDADAYHEGLKTRGLTPLLALHLREHPPADDIEASLLARTVKLSEHADPSRTDAERRRSLTEANRLLERLIDSHSDDARARAWRMELGKSLLYEEADALASALLYRGMHRADAERLRGLMVRTTGVLESLRATLLGEYEALDSMAAAQYDAMEAGGDVDRLESDLAQSAYMLAWGRYYHAAASGICGADSADTLHSVVDYLERESNLLYTPHAETHFQAQVQLLAGLSQRQLGRPTEAVSFFRDAIGIVEGILDDDERQSLAWVVQVGRIEMIRSLCDAGLFDQAAEALSSFREIMTEKDGGGRGPELVWAVLERSVFRSQSEAPDALPRDVGPLRERAVRGLRTMAASGPQARREVYATLYDLLGAHVEISTLTPFERCAVVSEMLVEAERLAERIGEAAPGTTNPESHAEREHLAAERMRLLDRAVEVTTELGAPGFAVASDTRGEALYFLGVAEHHRGRSLESAQAFLRAGRDHPSKDLGLEALVLAVRTAAELRRDDENATAELRTLYGEALAALVDRHPETEAGRYWRFFRAQNLAEEGRFDEAAIEYDRVSVDHVHAPEAGYLAAEARAMAITRRMSEGGKSANPPGDAAVLAIVTAAAAERGLLDAAEKSNAEPRRAELRRMAARAAVLHGELIVMHGVERGEQAIKALAGFETRYAGERELMGRVLRVRLLALHSLGRHDDATGLIPNFIEADPSGAASTLQGLLDAMRREIERDRGAGRVNDLRRRAETTFAVAEGLYRLATERPELFHAGATDALRVQLAEVALESEDYARAADLFAACRDADAARHEDGKTRDGRVIRGQAEAFYGLGRFEEALPLFNELFRSAERGGEMWWRALLRDLQCRAELRQDPGAIIKSIEQHKFYDKQMGGPELRRRFDALLSTSERRLDSTRGRSQPNGSER